MKHIQMKELEKKTRVELAQLIKEAKEALFTLRLDNETKKLKNTSSITLKRKEIARLLTAVNLKEVQKNG